MADNEKLTKKKSSKKTAKKAAKKITKKVSKKVAKKVTKKVAKKVTKKPVTRKISKKTSTKVSGKTNKKAKKKATKKTSVKSDSRLEELQDALSGINTEKAEVLAKNIWLAGLGAYSKTFDQISERVDLLQERYSTMNDEGQKLFQELVKRGDSMQNDIEETVKKGRDKLEDRVEDFKKRFGGSLSSNVDIRSRLKEAAKKVDELSDKLKKK